MKLLSAKGRRNSTHDGQDSSYFLGWQEYEKNPYHETRNPKGIIQMGVAENQLCLDLLESWLAQNPDAIAFGESSIFRQVAFSQDYHGLPSFKNAMVEFMSEIRGNKVTFDSNKLVLTAGATLANETLMFCLADLGDAFLVPTPYYSGFETDLKCRTEVEIVPIQCYSSNGFRITESALEEAYEEAQKRNLKVKGVLVTNPSNPLGTTLTRQELNLLLNFIDEKRIHLISHESYSGTVFDSPAFVSAMEVLTEIQSTTDAWDRVHIVYSLSKDLGLPGFRVGAIYSNDEMVVSAATEMSSRFGSFSSQTQYLLSAMLSDKTFIEKYVTENQERLEKRHGMFVKGLEESGIGCLDSNAGLFCWVDMRHLLSSNTFEAEIELWKKIVYDVGLNISPGSSCQCTEPGWFRACFANMSEATLHVAMQRIKAFVDSETAEDDQTVQSRRDNWNNDNNYSKWVFRLSFNDRETEVAER